MGHKDHWNPLAWYILDEVNIGCPSKGRSALSEERAASAEMEDSGILRFVFGIIQIFSNVDIQF